MAALEVGLHQCPSERKGEGVPVPSRPAPSHVPSHPQTAAKVQGFSPIASGFTAETDWLLEGSGFEPSVPRCARTADSAAVVWRRLIRAVSGGSSDRRPTTRSVRRGRQLLG